MSIIMGGKRIMKELIIVKPEKCVGCNSCVRTCPAPEANITKMLEDGRFITTVNPDRCIACGECVRNCAHGARDYIDDTEEALAAIHKEKMIVLATPAIKSTFPDKWKGILNWFRKQGQLIYDVSFGADICTWAHLRAIQKKTVGNVVTQPCAAIVKYIETYQPKLLKNLSPIHSPIMCGVVYIKKYLQRMNKIIVLSPCIAKKNEFMETGLVEYNVTFQKLEEFFEKNHVVIPPDHPGDFKYDFEGEQGQVGAIYPRADCVTTSGCTIRISISPLPRVYIRFIPSLIFTLPCPRASTRPYSTFCPASSAVTSAQVQAQRRLFLT